MVLETERIMAVNTRRRVGDCSVVVDVERSKGQSFSTRVSSTERKILQVDCTWYGTGSLIVGRVSYSSSRSVKSTAHR